MSAAHTIAAPIQQVIAIPMPFFLRRCSFWVQNYKKISISHQQLFFFL
jgi:hypothetical protein